MRSLYTSEVVERLRPQGVVIAHDYDHIDGAIPLPATLSRKLGERIGAHRVGERTRLYSEYPFPWRQEDGGPHDRFEREAWTELSTNPENPFYKFEEVNGRPSLRYATADLMREECVSCHNTHPASPKTDWQVGQVRGILEIIYPMGELESLAGEEIADTYKLMGLMSLLWLGGLGLVVAKLRRTSDELEQRVQHRTTELSDANQRLETEVRDRLLAEGALREAHDQLEERVQDRTAKLAEANADLLKEIVERKRAEEGIRQLNVDLLQQTSQLEASNQELQAFSYSVSHDLRAPLRGIDGFSQAVLEDYQDKLDATGQGYLQRVRTASQRMSQLIDAMIDLARLTRAELHTKPVNLSTMAQAILDDLEKMNPERQVKCQIAEGVVAHADPQLLQAVLENLLGNAWKFTNQHSQARIEFGLVPHNGHSAYFVRDNGAGFDMTYVHKLFGAFQRLHAFSEFPGIGIGLATVQRIIQRHGGKIWAEGSVGAGATFYFTL